MKTYYIKQNGYVIGTARGKSQAVQYIQKLLKLNGYVRSVWHTVRGDISVTVPSEPLVYTVGERI